MTVRRLSLSAALLASLLLLISGCGKKPDEGAGLKRPIEIKVAFWGAPAEVNIITEIIKKWQPAHKDILVRLEHTPHRGYIDKLLTRIAGGSAPDIICSNVDFFVTFQSKGALLELNSYIEKDPEVDTGDFFPEVVDRFTVKGSLYAIPRDTAPYACVYYNKKLFDEAGLSYPTDDWDVSELLDKAKKLTKFDADARVVQYGFFTWAWDNFIYAFGGSLVDDVKNPTRCTLDSKESIEGLEFYSDLINKYRVHPSSTAMINLAMNAAVMFENNRVAMFASGIWETPDLRHNIKGFDWDIAMFPKGPGSKRSFGTGGSGYCILKSTCHPEEAFEVLKALTNKDAQEMLASSGLAQPAMRAIAESPYWLTDNKPPTNKKMLNDAVRYTVYEPFHPAWREAKEVYINPELDLVFSGKKTAKDAVADIIDRINKLLRGR